MSHTPGPWKWSTNWHCYGPLKGAFVDDVGNTARIADVLSHGGVGTQETCEANARLIAAAPELLAACERALSIVDHRNNLNFMECAATLRAAIALAKGGA